MSTICRDLKQAQTQEWWLRIIEVAECGARDVLSRLIYKQIVNSDEAQGIEVNGGLYIKTGEHSNWLRL